MPVQFEKEQLERLFPFYILLKRDLSIERIGNSLHKMFRISNGDAFLNHFKVDLKVFSDPTFESLQTIAGQPIFIKSLDDTTVYFRGQFEYVKERDQLIYLGTPCFHQIEQLTSNGLIISDFASHDAMIDLLHALRSQEIAIEEVKSLVQQLNVQKKELQHLAGELESMALFTMENPDLLLRVGMDGTVLLQNPIAETFLREIEYNEAVYNASDFWKQIAVEIEQQEDRYEFEVVAQNRNYSFIIKKNEQSGYFNAYGRDITEQYQLQQDAIRSATQLESLIANMGWPVLLETETRHIAYTNEKFCRLFEIPVEPDLLKGTDCSGAADAVKHMFREPERFVSGILELIANKNMVLGERFELVDGRILSRDFIPMTYNGKHIGHLWMYADITMEEQAQRALETQKKFYEAILNNIPADVAVLDKDRHYLFLNPVAVKNPEIREWLIGKTDRDYVTFRKKATSLSRKREQEFEKAIQTKHLVKWEEVFQNADRQPIYQQRNYFPVTDANGNIEMVIGYGMDITYLKMIEEDLKKANRISKDTAKAKDAFFASMSHEIRTPLNGIIGITELLQKTTLNARQTEFLEMIRKSGDHLLLTVNDVLDFEKLVNGQFKLELHPFTVRESIENCVDLLRFKANEKGLKLITKFSFDHGLIVNGDLHRLEQILNNFLSNAIKFTERGTITLTVEHLPLKAKEVALKFVIADTGIGIEQDQLEHIFEPFRQARPDISRKYGGSGLGLAISSNLIQLHRGSVQVHSQVNEGTTFEFTLHYTQLPAVPQKRANRQQQFDAIRLSQLKILVAEDAEVNRFLIMHVLKSWNCKFKVVFNGAEAVEELQKNNYDLILMDIEMPVMNGIEAAAQIRNMKSRKKAQVPIMALTANAMRGMQDQYLQAGMNACITKPFTQHQLAEAMMNILFPEQTKSTDTIHEKPAVAEKSFDFEYLKSISDGDESFVQKMVELFLSALPGQISEIQDAFKAGSIETVASCLHKLKPSVQALGMQNVFLRVAALETEAKNGTVSKSFGRDLKEALENLERVRKELEKHAINK
ncbi:MAG: ATP-binding protein [Lacibacter sp.]